MSDEWMTTLKLQLSPEEYDRLPRHPAYKYELIEGTTYISPWPRHCHARLRLARFRVPAGAAAQANLRPATPADVEELTPILVRAFAHAQPFGSLGKENVQSAAQKSLRDVFGGSEGPLALPASAVAMNEERIVGAILITLLPGGDASEWDSYEWHEPALPDLWETARDSHTSPGSSSQATRRAPASARNSCNTLSAP